MPGVDIKLYSYFYPGADILAWQEGGDLSEELISNPITFVRNIGGYLETSKNSKAILQYVSEMLNVYSNIGEVLPEGGVLKDYSRHRNVEFYKTEGHVLVKHICIVMTLDNIKDAVAYKPKPDGA